MSVSPTFQTQGQTMLLCERLESRQLFTAGASAVLEWNSIAIHTLQMDRSRIGPGQAARSMAIVQTAVFDAVNAVHPQYESILIKVRRNRAANVDAAVAAAAHEALITLYPQQKLALDQAMHESLAHVHH